MYIHTCYPEIINLSVCVTVSYEEGVGAKWSKGKEELLDPGECGIFARYGNGFLEVPILTPEYIAGKSKDGLKETDLTNLLETAVLIINDLLIEPDRRIITHFDILSRLVDKYPEIGAILSEFK